LLRIASEDGPSVETLNCVKGWTHIHTSKDVQELAAQALAMSIPRLDHVWSFKEFSCFQVVKISRSIVPMSTKKAMRVTTDDSDVLFMNRCSSVAVSPDTVVAEDLPIDFSFEVRILGHFKIIVLRCVKTLANLASRPRC